jgi:hypothetical protein
MLIIGTEPCETRPMLPFNTQSTCHHQNPGHTAVGKIVEIAWP